MNRFFMLIFCIASFSVQAQTWGTSNILTFDSGDVFYPTLISIDTTHYHRNIWQVGKPDKTVFTSAYSAPNAIITDTLNPYPVNDTSVFIAKIPGYYMDPTISPIHVFSFEYQLDIDSGSIARVEISEDSGAHWENIVDTLPTHYYWPILIPDLSHSTSGWTALTLNRDWSPASDTILFRFTFISDSTFANKDGWIIDNIFCFYQWEGIPQVQNNNLITIGPNPSGGDVYIHTIGQAARGGSVVIDNMLGEEVYKAGTLPPGGHIHLSLPGGIYFLKYYTPWAYTIKRIMIE